MNWTLEVVIVPVSDVDRAKKFYADQLGFTVDHDTVISDEARIVQLTPPGSGCSIVIGKGVVPQMPPGSLRGLQLAVPDLKRAHKELVGRGVEVSDIQVVGRNPPAGAGSPGQCRFRLLRRPGRQHLGRPADLQPRLTGPLTGGEGRCPGRATTPPTPTWACRTERPSGRASTGLRVSDRTRGCSSAS